jgi:lipopolysaccharide/colanic/teichoic acid biosynthesis glycosyltransferase
MIAMAGFHPGMTELWQVSGRSDLSWDEAVRLDLGSVENWSFSLDCVILRRTKFRGAGVPGLIRPNGGDHQ